MYKKNWRSKIKRFEKKSENKKKVTSLSSFNVLNTVQCKKNQTIFIRNTVKKSCYMQWCKEHSCIIKLQYTINNNKDIIQLTPWNDSTDMVEEVWWRLVGPARVRTPPGRSEVVFAFLKTHYKGLIRLNLVKVGDNSIQQWNVLELRLKKFSTTL